MGRCQEKEKQHHLLTNPAALPLQRALSHPLPYLLPASLTKGMKPTAVCSISASRLKSKDTSQPLCPKEMCYPLQFRGNAAARHPKPSPSCSPCVRDPKGQVPREGQARTRLCRQQRLIQTKSTQPITASSSQHFWEPSGPWQRGVPCSRTPAALLADKVHEDACSQTQAVPHPGGNKKPGWIFLPRRPRFSRELALASSSPPPAHILHSPSRKTLLKPGSQHHCNTPMC